MKGGDKKLYRLLELEDVKVQDLTELELDLLWDPTFDRIDRWICFLSAPYVLFLFNGIFTFVVTALFSWWFLLMRLTPELRIGLSNLSPDRLEIVRAEVVPGLMPSELVLYQISVMEITLCCYFACSLVRECSQLFVSVLQHGKMNGFQNYFLDFWNFSVCAAPVCECV